MIVVTDVAITKDEVAALAGAAALRVCGVRAADAEIEVQEKGDGSLNVVVTREVVTQEVGDVQG